MSKRGVPVILLVVVLAVAILLFFANKSGILTLTKGNLTIAFVGDLSSNDSMRALDGVNIAVLEINKNKGINGKPINLQVFDTNGNEQKAEEIFSHLSKTNTLAVISTHYESDFAEQYEMPTIFVGPALTFRKNISRFWWGLRNQFVMTDHVYWPLNSIKQGFDIKSMVIITDEDSDNQDFTSGIKRVSKSLNIEILSDKEFNKNDLQNIVKEFKAQNPEMVIISLRQQNGLDLLQEAKNQNLNPKIFLTSYTFPRFRLEQKEDLLPENLYIASFILTSSRKVLENPRNHLEEIQSKYFNNTGRVFTTPNLISYESVYLFKKAIEDGKVSFNPNKVKQDRIKIRDALWSINNLNIIRGSLTPDIKTGYFRRYYISIMQLKDGEYQLFTPQG